MTKPAAKRIGKAAAKNPSSKAAETGFNERAKAAASKNEKSK